MLKVKTGFHNGILSQYLTASSSKSTVDYSESSTASRAGPSASTAEPSASRAEPSASRAESSASRAGVSASKAESSTSRARVSVSKAKSSTSRAGPSTSSSDDFLTNDTEFNQTEWQRKRTLQNEDGGEEWQPEKPKRTRAKKTSGSSTTKGEVQPIPPAGQRKRGRPQRTADYVPLTKEQKQERNKVYEKERREACKREMDRLKHLLADELPSRPTYKQVIQKTEEIIAKNFHVILPYAREKRRNEELKAKLRELQKTVEPQAAALNIFVPDTELLNDTSIPQPYKWELEDEANSSNTFIPKPDTAPLDEMDPNTLDPFLPSEMPDLTDFPIFKLEQESPDQITLDPSIPSPYNWELGDETNPLNTFSPRQSEQPNGLESFLPLPPPDADYPTDLLLPNPFDFPLSELGLDTFLEPMGDFDFLHNDDMWRTDINLDINE